MATNARGEIDAGDADDSQQVAESQSDSANRTANQENSQKVPWVVHVQPVVHYQTEAEGAMDAQLETLEQLKEALSDAFEGTDFEVHEVETDGAHVDQTAIMEEMMSQRGHGLEDIGGLFDGAAEGDMDVYPRAFD